MADFKDDVYHRELNTLLKFSTLINSSLKIETVLDNAMNCAEEFINAEASTIYEKDEEKNDLFIRLARGEKKDSLKAIRVKMGEGIAGHVVETGMPMVINDVTHEKRFSKRLDLLTGFRTRSLICVPLFIKGSAMGAIQVLNKRTGEDFSERDIELLTSLSQLIAVAIENARLYERLEHDYELTSQDLKTARERLIRTERAAAMGQLVNSVAHEIRNPVMVIGGFARRLKTRFSQDPEAYNYTDIILGEVTRLERLVNQVRRLSEVQGAELKKGSVIPVMDRIIKAFGASAEKQGVTLNTSIEKPLPDIYLDEAQLYTALSNLFENAFDSMTNGGSLSLAATAFENHIVIEVNDTGTGIEDTEIATIYDPFVTSKKTGVGLGLTMVQQIVMNHCGEITVKSRKNEGTHIEIRLPVS
jgi:two-component system sensor histidine kinase HydH